MSRPNLRSTALVAIATLLVPAIHGCSTKLETGMSASDADSLVALLHAHQVGATKQPGSHVGGSDRFDVSVLNAELAQAMAVLRSTTPRARAGGYPAHEPSWIPTPSDELFRLNAESARQLEGTLRMWDGVVDTRVQIALTAAAERRVGAAGSTPTAAVVIKHRTAATPSAAAVQTLVAHAVAGLQPEDVNVVLIETQPPPSAQLSQLGPIAVTAGSAQMLRVALIALLLAVATFATVVAWAWRRGRSNVDAS